MDLTPALLLRAYRRGIFPMGDSDEPGQIYWFRPDPRGILPLDRFYVPKDLRRLVRQERFEVRSDHDFEGVIRGCAERARTWITEDVVAAYVALHERGYAHSVECWQEGRLVGGLYGVALGGAFFGESMFHRVSNASKVALVHLVRRLQDRGFTLLDVQWTTPHLEQFGAVEIPLASYERRLEQALRAPASWQG